MGGAARVPEFILATRRAPVKSKLRHFTAEIAEGAQIIYKISAVSAPSAVK